MTMTPFEFYGRHSMWCPLCATSCSVTFIAPKRGHVMECPRCKATYFIEMTEIIDDADDGLYVPIDIDRLTRDFDEWKKTKKVEE